MEIYGLDTVDMFLEEHNSGGSLRVFFDRESKKIHLETTPYTGFSFVSNLNDDMKDRPIPVDPAGDRDEIVSSIKNLLGPGIFDKFQVEINTL